MGDYSLSTTTNNIFFAGFRRVTRTRKKGPRNSPHHNKIKYFVHRRQSSFLILRLEFLGHSRLLRYKKLVFIARPSDFCPFYLSDCNSLYSSLQHLRVHSALYGEFNLIQCTVVTSLELESVVGCVTKEVIFIELGRA